MSRDGTGAPSSHQGKAKKRSRRLVIAYAMRSAIILLLIFMIVLMICGVLYIREHLARVPDSESPDGNMESDDSALSELPIVPIKPAIPGDITIPDWVVQDILPINEYSRPGIALSEVNGVVVHYTGNPGTTAEQNRSYYKNLADTKETYASSHFVIGMDGKIIQCIPLDEIAYCSDQRNDDTISIECCHSDDTGQFSQATLDALVQLLNWLIKTYELSRDDILRHYDVIVKECPYYFVKHPDAWEGLLNSLTYANAFCATNFISKGQSMKSEEWIRRPVCGNKTHDRIRDDTILLNFPLYCPKCKRETLIEVQQQKITVIKEPDA